MFMEWAKEKGKKCQPITLPLQKGDDNGVVPAWHIPTVRVTSLQADSADPLNM